MILNILGGGGSGKTTLKFALLATGKFRGVVPFTTRLKRPEEADGVHYHFIAIEQFTKMEFIISRMASGWYYGVRREDLFAQDDQRVVVTTFDHNGVNLLAEMNVDIRVVCLQVSSNVRESRMRHRGDNDSEVQTRIAFDSVNIGNIDVRVPCIIIGEEDPGEVINQVLVFANVSL